MNEYKWSGKGKFYPASMLKETNKPIFSGRPKRNTVISDDDICNLKIALNTAKTIDEFVAMV